MESLLIKLMEPNTLQLISEIIILALYLTGRITKAQLIAEQLKAKSPMASEDAKKLAVDKATVPLTFIFDALNQIPVLNTQLPFVKASVPELGKTLVQFPFGILNDILFNTPIFGNKAK